MFIPGDKCLFFFLVGDVVETNSVADFPTSGIVWWKFVSESCGVLERTPPKKVYFICIESSPLSSSRLHCITYQTLRDRLRS